MGVGKRIPRRLVWALESLGPDTFTRAKARYFSGVLTRLARGYDAYTFDGCRRVDEGDERPCWELTLRGPRHRRHEAGDSLLLGWDNDPHEVERLLEVLRCPGDRVFTFRGGPAPLVQGLRTRASLRELLTRHVEIRRPGGGLGELLGVGAPSQDEPASGHGHGQGTRSPAPRVIDLLEAHPGVDAATFLDLQPGAPGRLYVLSRVERRTGGDRVSVLVREAVEPFLDRHGGVAQSLGRASRSVAALAAADRAPGPVWAVALPHPFRIDAGPGRGPQILAVTGTGVASVAVALRASKIPRGSWLVYGVRTWVTDALEAHLLLEALAQGTFDRIDVALSRPGPGVLPEAQGLTFHRGLRVPGIFGLLEAETRRRLDRGDRVYACGHTGLGTDLERVLTPWVGGSEAWKAARESRRIQLSVS